MLPNGVAHERRQRGFQVGRSGGALGRWPWAWRVPRARLSARGGSGAGRPGCDRRRNRRCDWRRDPTSRFNGRHRRHRCRWPLRRRSGRRMWMRRRWRRFAHRHVGRALRRAGSRWGLYRRGRGGAGLGGFGGRRLDTRIGRPLGCCGPGLQHPFDVAAGRQPDQPPGADRRFARGGQHFVARALAVHQPQQLAQCGRHAGRDTRAFLAPALRQGINPVSHMGPPRFGGAPQGAGADAFVLGFVGGLKPRAGSILARLIQFGARRTSRGPTQMQEP